MCWVRKPLKIEGLWNGYQVCLRSTHQKDKCIFPSVWSCSWCWVWCHQCRQTCSVPCIMHLHSVVHYCTLLATILNAWCSLSSNPQEVWAATVEKSPAGVLNKSLDSATTVQCATHSAAVQAREKITMCSETASPGITLVLSLNYFSFSNKFPFGKNRLFLCFFDAFYVI